MSMPDMAEFKLTIGHPKGKSYKRDITGKEADALLGKDIGEAIAGDALGFAGYEFQVMGGSDYSGVPMRRGIKGASRKRILMYGGVGFSGLNRWKKRQNGLRRKKTVCGQKIHTKITQVNLKIVKEGPTDLFAEQKEEKAEAPKEEKKPEVKKEVKKEELKNQEKAAEKKEPPKEEGKPEVKEEKKEESKHESPKEVRKEVNEESVTENPAQEAKPAEKPQEEAASQ
jgi:small subunit ribosomal protein S6e